MAAVNYMVVDHRHDESLDGFAVGEEERAVGREVIDAGLSGPCAVIAVK